MPNLIAYIERQEIKARERQEAAERAAVERAEREERARILSSRRSAYDVWEKSLVTGFEEWDKIQRLRRYIDALEAFDGSDEMRQFVEWALGHVDTLDPVKNFQLPTTEIPDLTHNERARYGEYQGRHQYGNGYY